MEMGRPKELKAIEEAAQQAGFNPEPDFYGSVTANDQALLISARKSSLWPQLCAFTSICTRLSVLLLCSRKTKVFMAVAVALSTLTTFLGLYFLLHRHGAAATSLMAPQVWGQLEGARLTTLGDIGLRTSTPSSPVVVATLNNVQWISTSTATYKRPLISATGAFLSLSGPFSCSVQLGLNGSSAAGSLHLWESLPGAPGQRGGHLALGLSGDKAVASFYGRSSDSTPAYTNKSGPGAVQLGALPFMQSGQASVNTVSLTFSSDGPGAGLTVSYNSQGAQHGVLSLSPDIAAFASGQAYFGVDMSAGVQLYVLNLACTGGASLSDPWSPPIVPLTGLGVPHSGRTLAVGSAVAVYDMVADSGYGVLIGQQFSMVEEENAFKFQYLHPAPGVYSFKEADALAKFAVANGRQLLCHTLSWHNSLPTWLVTGTYSPQDLAAILEDYIKTVVGHFKGQCTYWDVLNEPLDDTTNGMRASIWYRALGADYVPKIFAWARQADPSAKLYINEHTAFLPLSRAKALLNMVSGWLQAGVPIDGVAFQAHAKVGSAANPTYETAFATLQAFGALGIKTRISEADDYISAADIGSADALTAQARYFVNLARACTDASSCEAISTWGFSDKFTSVPPQTGYSAGLLLDSSNQPKPAFVQLQALLAA